MSFRINEYSIIPISKRPKLYKEMEINPYGLSKLDLSKIFTYMDEKNEKINEIIRDNYHEVTVWGSEGELTEATLLLLLSYFLKSKFIYFWLHWISVAMLSLVVASRGQLLVAVHELLIAVASLVSEHGLWSVWAQ